MMLENVLKITALRCEWIVILQNDINPLSATYILQQTTKSNIAAFSKITNKACYFMRIVCWQTILHENRLLADDSHEISCLIFLLGKLGKISQSLSSAAVVIVPLRVKIIIVLMRLYAGFCWPYL